MSESRCAHLVSAHDLVAGWRLSPIYVALCGALVDTSNGSDTDCPNECECEVVHCPACLQATTEYNRGPGVDVAHS